MQPRALSLLQVILAVYRTRSSSTAPNYPSLCFANHIRNNTPRLTGTYGILVCALPEPSPDKPRLSNENETNKRRGRRDDPNPNRIRLRIQNFLVSILIFIGYMIIYFTAIVFVFTLSFYPYYIQNRNKGIHPIPNVCMTIYLTLKDVIKLIGGIPDVIWLCYTYNRDHWDGP